MTASTKASQLQLALAFLCIYTIWGSTYLAIRIGITSIPPFLMLGVRYVIAGSLLYAWSRMRGAAKPIRAHWKNSAIIGFLLLLMGNGSIAWSEQRVSSGMASLLVATLPLWVVLIELYKGRRPAPLQWVGVAAGLFGVGLLVLPAGNASGAAVNPIGALVLTVGTFAWTVGSLYSRTAQLATSVSLASGMQMLCGGAFLLAASVVHGEWSSVQPRAITAHSLLALLYLIVFGSLIGFSTYMWLLKAASPAAVGTYAYVNPVVAVLLGVFVLGETLPPSAVVAMFVIVGSVALVSLAPYLAKRSAQAG